MSNAKHLLFMGAIVGGTIFLVHALGLAQIVLPQT